MTYKHTNIGNSDTVIYEDGVGHVLKKGESVNLKEQYIYPYITIWEQKEPKRIKKIKTIMEDD